MIARWLSQHTARFLLLRGERKYRMCCYAPASDILTEGEPILDYAVGMTLCEPLTAYDSAHYWLEPVF